MKYKWEARDRKLRKRRSLAMVVKGRSLKTVVVPAIEKRANKAKEG